MTSSFTVSKGQERRVPLRFRLRWESPVSEVRGEQLDGVRLGVYTFVEAGGISGRTDSDPLRIGATQLHEAVLDAFAAAGYSCRSAKIDDEYIPRTERQILYMRQSFRLVDTSAVTGPDRPQQLEVNFHTNAVGSEIYVRKAALHQKDWWMKPPVLRYVAAHHEAGHVDFEARVRRSGSTRSRSCPRRPSTIESGSSTTWEAPGCGSTRSSGPFPGRPSGAVRVLPAGMINLARPNSSRRARVPGRPGPSRHRRIRTKPVSCNTTSCRS
ncbi:sporulation protein [Streptomyces sp. DK15]|nr:sporulation protein [Streptomyces sp. DK15]